MRTILLLSALVTVVAFPSTAGAATRACPQSDPANGLSGLRTDGQSCKAAFRVAKRTNSVKCFLNGNSCTHTYRGRSWRCVLRGGERVTCRSSGPRVVKYRLG